MGGVELRIATKIDEQKVDFLVDMINEIYLESEENIWVDGHLRIIPNRLIEII